MNASCKLVLGGLVGLLMTSLSPVYAQSHGRQNCHLGTASRVAPNVPVKTYTPGYASDTALINGLRIDVNRGTPLNRVDVSKLTTPHVGGVPNGKGGFDHCFSAGPHANGFRGIVQNFHTDPSKYQSQFRTGQEFLNQTVHFGGQARQTYRGQGDRIQIYCVGGACPQHPPRK
jgi:hypothetical protein